MIDGFALHEVVFGDSGAPVDYVFLEVNAAYEAMTGLRRDAIVGRRVTEVLPDIVDDPFDWIAWFGRVAVSGESARTEQYASTLSRWYSVNAYCPQPGRFAAIVEDITERKRDAEALREALEREKELVRAANVGLWEWDFATGRVRYSVEWKRQLGYEDHEISDDFDEWQSRLHPDDLPGVLAEVDETIRTVAQNHQTEFRMRHRDGSYRSILSQGTVVTNDAGEPVRLRGSHIDLTEVRQAEAERELLRRQLAETQRIEALGRLAGGIAHDLNNLLAPILGYGEILLEESRDDETRREPAEAIVQAGTRARDLVRQLLAFSRKQALAVEVIDLNALLREFDALLRSTIRKDVDIVMHLADDLPPIEADKRQLEQVVMNLAINARDAMPGGGTMTIETRTGPHSTEGQPTGGTSNEQSFVRLIVSDEGDGIDETTRLHIFDPFFTTKGDVRGTGLGLATVYGIVKQHRGEIYAESRKGHGSSFHVFLPASAEPASTVGPEESASAPTAATPGGTVLVIEDEDSVRSLIKLLLERNGFTVVEASGGEAAIAAMESMPSPPRLLLTDVVMPKMNGPEVVERIRARYPDVRVLYMSGYADDVRGAERLVRTGKDLLEKPFSEASLLEKIDAALRDAPGADSES